MASLENKVALVTGAGRGIGKTIARMLAEKGMQVGINDVDPVLLENVTHEFHSKRLRVLGLPGDITNKGQVASIVDRVEEALGPLWLMVNNAGVFNFGPTLILSCILLQMSPLTLPAKW